MVAGGFVKKLLLSVSLYDYNVTIDFTPLVDFIDSISSINHKQCLIPLRRTTKFL